MLNTNGMWRPVTARSLRVISTVLIFVVALASLTQAQTIRQVCPIAATAASQQTGTNDQRIAPMTINLMGMDANGRHISGGEGIKRSSWLSGSAAPNTQWIKYDFARAAEISQIKVWNYNGAGGTNQGIQTCHIWYSNTTNAASNPLANPGEWTRVNDSSPIFTLRQATGTLSDQADLLTLPAGLSGRWWCIVVVSNYGGANRTGLCQVMFYGPNAAYPFSFGMISSDADAGVSSGNTYTHALDTGSNIVSPVVNGVTFTEVAQNTVGANFTMAFSNNNGGNGNFLPTGGIGSVMTDMIYGNGGAANFTLTGLTPGTAYDLRIYSRPWDHASNSLENVNSPSNVNGARTVGLTFDNGNDGTIEDTLILPLDNPRLPPVSLPAFGPYFVSYRYVATGTAIKVAYPTAIGGAGYDMNWHFYGVTNHTAATFGFDRAATIVVNETVPAELRVRVPARDFVTSFTFTTQDGSAVAGTDFLTTTGIVEVPASGNFATISIPMVNRPGIQRLRNFKVNLVSNSLGQPFGAITEQNLVIQDGPINPIAAATSSEYTGRTGGNTINHSGLAYMGDAVAGHDTGAGSLWNSGAFDGTRIVDEWVKYDFARSVDLGQIKIWNMNEAGASNRSVRECQFYVSETGNATPLVSPADWTLVPNPADPVNSYYALLQAPGTANYTGMDPIDLPDGTLGRSFLILVKSNHGGNAVGLSEVRFYGDSALTYRAFSNDADSGISTSNFYTHAVDTGNVTAALTVNGVPFVKQATAPFFSSTFTGYAQSNYDYLPVGQTMNLMQDINFGGAVNNITLSGLTPGLQYDLRCYSRPYDTNNRRLPLIFYNGATVEETLILPEDDARILPVPLPARGNYYVSYKFIAAADSVKVERSADVSGAADAWHVYGLTCQAATPGYVQFLLTSSSGLESVNPAQFELKMIPTDHPTTLTYKTRRGTATPGVDYGTGADEYEATVIIPANVNSAFLTVPIIAHAYPELSRTFTVDITAVGDGMYLGPQRSHAFTILDDRALDPFQTQNFSFELGAAPNYPGYGAILGWTSTDQTRTGINPEAGGTSPFANNGAIPDGSRVGFLQAATLGGMTGLSQSLSGFAAGKTYNFSLYANARNGYSSPTLQVNLNGTVLVPKTMIAPGSYNPFYASFTAPGAGPYLLEIQNYNDEGGDKTLLVDKVEFISDIAAFTIPDSGVVEGQRTSTLTVILAFPAPVGGLTLDWRTLDGTALSGVHYQGASGTLTFPAGATTAQVPQFPTTDDGILAGNRSFSVELIKRAGVELSLGATWLHTITLFDNVADIRSNLAGHWEFEEGAGATTFDSVAAIPGTLENGAAFTPGGRFGSGMTINGSKQDVQTALAISELSTTYTFSGWVYQTGPAPAYATLFSSRVQGIDSALTAALHTNYSSTGYMGVMWNNVGYQSTLRTPAVGEGWTFVAATIEAKRIRMYRGVYGEGLQSWEMNLATPITSMSLSDPIVIGRDKGSPNVAYDTRYINGVVDDARVYQRALNPADIATLFLYNPGKAPIADAGLDQTIVVGQKASLDASLTYAPVISAPITYAWTLVSSSVVAGTTPTATIAMPNAALSEAEFSWTALGSYVFMVTCSVNEGNYLYVTTDTVTVMVVNDPPQVSVAYDPDPLFANETTFTLTASATDIFSAIPLTYFWEVTSGVLSIEDPNSAATTGTIPGPTGKEWFVVRMTVSDGLTSVTADLHVLRGIINLKPVALVTAEDGIVVMRIKSVMLDGSASYDPDSYPAPLTYLWEQISGPGAGAVMTLATPYAPATAISNVNRTGLYVIRLTVSDGILTDQATVSIIVQPPASAVTDWTRY